MKVYGIIPARKNSVRVPRKNIVHLRGKPLIEYTIDAAKQSGVLERIIVSTDCCQTANIAAACGVQVVMRPEGLSRGDGIHPGVIAAHCIDSMDKPDAICWLQPSSPLRESWFIGNAVRMMKLSGCDSVVSYVCGEPLSYLAKVDAHNRVHPLELDIEGYQLCVRSGDIYLTKTDVLLSLDLYGQDSRALIIPRERYCNINEPVDLKIAEALL